MIVLDIYLNVMCGHFVLKKQAMHELELISVFQSLENGGKLFVLQPAPAGCVSFCLVLHISGVCSTAGRRTSNICSKVWLFSTGLMFVRRQEKHNAAFL